MMTSQGSPVSVQNAPRIFRLTSQQFDWQSEAICRPTKLLTRLAMVKYLVTELPEVDLKEAASSINS